MKGICSKHPDVNILVWSGVADPCPLCFEMRDKVEVALPNVIDALSARERKGRNDGLEAAALYLESHADKDGFLVGRVPPTAAAIRALKEID